MMKKVLPRLPIFLLCFIVIGIGGIIAAEVTSAVKKSDVWVLANKRNQLPLQVETILPTTKKLVVFIHGTFFPLLSAMREHFDIPCGFLAARTVRPDSHFMMARIAKGLGQSGLLDESDELFFLGWTGNLSPQARAQAAEELVGYIGGFAGEVVLIGHSHGGNVALRTVAKLLDTTSSAHPVVSVVLLATPVQDESETCVDRPGFPPVYSLYSQGDLVQVADPQGLNREKGKTGPFFSKHCFEDKAHIKQRAVVENEGKRVGHNDFVHYPFLMRLKSFLDECESSTALAASFAEVDELQVK